jgi:predicted ATPase/class 3 adenylate cyclase/Flp pilus assembly protein TadD
MTSQALLFTDLVDSTALVERLGDARAAELFAAHDKLARSLLGVHHGREIDRADGFFMIFDDVGAACSFALAYQRGAAELDLHPRVGIHTGPVVLRINAPEDVARGAKPIEVEGLSKPIAARIMGLARGRQTLLSSVARQALNEPYGDADLRCHGHFRLKGIDEPIEIHELGRCGVAAFVPPADTPKAYRVVRAGELWSPAHDVRHNLPAERDAFIGRSTELQQIARRFDDGARLLTLLGTGGTGKTRCACRFGWMWLGDWPGGVYFCDLSEARSLDAIHFAVAGALGVPLGREEPASLLGNVIAGRGCCLLILDNFEQVVAHAEAAIGLWLDLAPKAAFLVTSRERLQVRGEQALPIEPLELDQDALALFTVRARARQPEFVLDDATRDVVAQIVRLLDGLPLAIELAAARVPVLSPPQLLERMRDRFRVLGHARGAAARHATLHAAIDWSWQLLEPWEQSALAQCSVFDGGFTLAAAEAVFELSAWPQAPPTIDVIQALVDKSLLRTSRAGPDARLQLDEPYFGMYISIHDYAAEQLRAAGEEIVQASEARHGDHFARYGRDDAIESLSRHGGVQRRRRLALELDNLVSATRRAAAHGRPGVAVSCFKAACEVLNIVGPASLEMALGSDLLRPDGLDDCQRGAVLGLLGVTLRTLGRLDEARTALEQALGIARTQGNRPAEGVAHASLGNLLRDQGHPQLAHEHLQAALAIHRQCRNPRAEGQVLGNLGIVHAQAGRFEEARSHFERALVTHRAVGNRRYEGIDLNNLANTHLDQGQLDIAATHLIHALKIHRELDNRREEGIVLHNLARLRRGQGDLPAASRDCAASLAIAREIGLRHLEAMSLDLQRALCCDEGRLADAMDCTEQALALQRSIGSRRGEGRTLGLRGEVLALQGRSDDAMRDFAQGAALLRETASAVDLVTLTCTRGHAELTRNDRDAALRSLRDAELLAAPLHIAPSTEAAFELARLRKALHGDEGPSPA